MTTNLKKSEYKRLISFVKARELQKKMRREINASRRKAQCDCCGRQLNELKPYGKAGDPIESNFEGKFLVKAFRPTIPVDDEADKKWEEFFGNCHNKKEYKVARERLIQAYGTKEVLKIELYKKAYSNPVVWLCRDCIILGPDDYLEARAKRYENSYKYSWFIFDVCQQIVSK